jgi:ribosomal protein L7/L12
MAENTLVIEGWNIGFNKVVFTKLLQQELGLSLSSAKEMTDQVLEGKRISVSVLDQDMGRITEAVHRLGAKVIRNSVAAEDSCQ